MYILLCDYQALLNYFTGKIQKTDSSMREVALSVKVALSNYYYFFFFLKKKYVNPKNKQTGIWLPRQAGAHSGQGQ